MLITQAFTDLLVLVDNGVLPDVFDSELKGKIAITVFQAVSTFRRCFLPFYTLGGKNCRTTPALQRRNC